MDDRIYRVTEIVASSGDGVDQAIGNAVARARGHAFSSYSNP
jgi:flavin-binding protein dodecin